MLLHVLIQDPISQEQHYVIKFVSDLPAHDNKQAWRHNYMSGTHTAKFLVCHYLLTLMGGEEWVGGDIIT
jgi:hypothetical protein